MTPTADALRPTTSPAEIEFTSHGSLCRGYWYPARGAGKAACIVMAHGLGGTRDLGLTPYAERFHAAGAAVLVFDYRGFGSSEGGVRQVVSVRRQLDDWQAAIDFARTLPGVDPDRIALWGSSFAGGHVVRAAVRDGRVRAVSAQCPMMDGVASSLAVVSYAGLLYALRLMLHGVADVLASMVGASHLIPLVAPPGHIAAMSSSDDLSGLRALEPATGFVNAIGARISLSLAAYRPGRDAGALPCPILIQICEQDRVAPPRSAERAAKKAGSKATVVRYPVGHFDVYRGHPFEQSVRDQTAFFQRHLGLVESVPVRGAMPS